LISQELAFDEDLIYDEILNNLKNNYNLVINNSTNEEVEEENLET